MQAPMISVPLKATNEIDWIQPLKKYIRQTYGDDPERYSEECAMLNRLRQDMRGAGKDSASGRDLLYRYYGQLELLDLRFPVDENHIKISFTWFDAFTQKPTSQYSLAYEKASIIFNISAVLSCHAAHQSRTEDSGLKIAYHSFQASADLSRDTVKTLIQIMLAQGQEVFLEKQIADGKKFGLLAKLASQAGHLYSHVLEGTQENVNKAIFEKVWLLVIQIKSTYMTSLSQYYQALADDDANSHGIAISRLQVAEAAAKEATKLASSFPGTVPASSNLASESGAIFLEITKRHLTHIQENLTKFTKDNDYIYHQIVPLEAALAIIPKLAAAKAIPVSQLYTGQDIQRITGPDIFQKIVPISVTESASLYDEEKAKLIRAETERVESANSEMAASLDYLHLPSALHVIKGNFDQKLIADDEFKRWCQEIANNCSPPHTSDYLESCRENIIAVLDKCSQQLDIEESVCEKMRSKYEANWTQQPSSRLTITLRSDIRSYRDALQDASSSDSQLLEKFARNQTEFDEMRSAGQMDEAEVLFQKALIQFRGNKNPETLKEECSLLDDDFGNNISSVMEQVARVEDILKKLNLIKRERSQVLKDLKEKVHNDDISQVLILNKKSLSNYEAELFQAELEKFRPHQSRLASANHKQMTLMKELTSTLNTLLQDKRVKAEQSKFESLSRQRSSVMSKYKRVYLNFLEYESGIKSAKEWYRGMKDTVDSLGKNVETFFNNRRSEGAQLLNQIEKERNINEKVMDKGNERLPNLMEQMFITPPSFSQTLACNPMTIMSSSQTNFSNQHQISNTPPPIFSQPQASNFKNSSSEQNPGRFSPKGIYQSQDKFSATHNPLSHLHGDYNLGINSSMPVLVNQPSFPNEYENSGRPLNALSQLQQLPPGYIPPPPPPGPPPLLPQQTFPNIKKSMTHEIGQGNQSHQSSNDPWSGLDSWR